MAKKQAVKKGGNSSLHVEVELPSEIVSPRLFVIELSPRAVDVTRQAQDALTVSRGIEPDLSVISATHITALMVKQQASEGGQDMSGTEAVAKAQNLHKKWMQAALRDGYTIGMSYLTDLSGRDDPDDYDFNDAVDPDQPLWLQAIRPDPRPNYNMRDPFERRLKQINELLTDAGPMFNAVINGHINNAIAKALDMVKANGAAGKSGDDFRVQFVGAGDSLREIAGTDSGSKNN